MGDLIKGLGEVQVYNVHLNLIVQCLCKCIKNGYGSKEVLDVDVVLDITAFIT